MPLPKHKESVFYTTVLPSGLKLKFRSWKVKEEKQFLFSIDGVEDENQIIDSIIDLIKSCCKDESQIDKLSDIDLLALAVEMRKKTKGEEVDVVFKCPHCDTKVDDHVMDLNKAAKFKPADNSPIDVGEYTFQFRELTRLEKQKNLDQFSNPDEVGFYNMIDSMVSVEEDGQVFNHFTREEAEEFLDGLDPNLFKELVKEYTQTRSNFDISSESVCPKCKKDIKVRITDILSFFV